MKRVHVQAYHKWGPHLALELRDCTRSCERGLGPALQAEPLRLTPSLLSKRGAAVALKSGVDAVLLGAWWLLREIELSGLRRCDSTPMSGVGCGTMTLDLAVSKCDPTARGVKRTLACACPSVFCPVAGACRVLGATAGQGAGASPS